MINAIITGSSGMVGGAILQECLESKEVESVLVINRRKLNINHPKLKELIVEDFADIKNYKEHLAGFNACFLSLGSLTTFGKKTYENINYYVPISFAKAVLHANPDISICYVSGAGADSSESSKIMQLRIKGKTENALLNLGFKSAFMFRPTIILPDKIFELKFLYKIFYSLIKPLNPILKALNLAVESSQMGRAMVNAIKNREPKNILETRDIIRLSSE
jgi:uncharacterized protein YbjT (DUF2867 family)